MNNIKDNYTFDLNQHNEEYIKTFKEYEKSAINGCPYAQFNLGVVCTKGHGTKRDYEKAIRCFQIASIKFSGRDLENAYNALTEVYQKIGDDKNFVKYFFKFLILKKKLDIIDKIKDIKVSIYNSINITE